MNKMKSVSVTSIMIISIFALFALRDTALAASKGGKPMEIKSPAFAMGGMIPPKYSCTGENVSPPLTWKEVPMGTKSIAIITDDPDAPMGSWVHWVFYDIPASVHSLGESIPQGKKPAVGGTQGMNDSRNLGYDGPCPPSGTHRYYFKVYALDTALGLPPGATKKDVVKAMDGHVLGESVLMGKFSK
jgi:Raf kinase inhibitor-like YbhB/YbcL family protein